MECALDGCTLKVAARGLCGKHYRKWLGGRLPDYEAPPRKTGMCDLDAAKRQYESTGYDGETLMDRPDTFFGMAAAAFNHHSLRLTGELLLMGYSKAERQEIYRNTEGCTIMDDC